MVSPLTIISNRAPYKLKKKSGQISFEKNVGGLVSVLDEIMCQGGGTWIAWGESADTPSRVGIPLDDPKYFMRLVDLTDLEVRNYYQGFSNRVMWPLCHYFLDRCHFRSEYWKAYRGVNEKFARAVGILGDAVIVNPYEFDDVTKSIHLSLTMQEGEKRSRMQRLRQAVKRSDVYWWCQSFLRTLMDILDRNAYQESLFPTCKVL